MSSKARNELVSTTNELRVRVEYAGRNAVQVEGKEQYTIMMATAVADDHDGNLPTARCRKLLSVVIGDKSLQSIGGKS